MTHLTQSYPPPRTRVVLVRGPGVFRQNVFAQPRIVDWGQNHEVCYCAMPMSFVTNDDKDKERFIIHEVFILHC